LTIFEAYYLTIGIFLVFSLTTNVYELFIDFSSLLWLDSSLSSYNIIGYSIGVLGCDGV